MCYRDKGRKLSQIKWNLLWNIVAEIVVPMPYLVYEINDKGILSSVSIIIFCSICIVQLIPTRIIWILMWTMSLRSLQAFFNCEVIAWLRNKSDVLTYFVWHTSMFLNYSPQIVYLAITKLALSENNNLDLNYNARKVKHVLWSAAVSIVGNLKVVFVP